MDNINWTTNTNYPKGIKGSLILIFILTILLLFSTIYIHYPIYQTFYGIVEKSENATIKIALTKEQLEPFEQALLKNNIKLQKIDTELIAGENIIYAYVVMSISKKLLVENNIIPIRLKIKNVNLWKELSQKWKEGIKDETNRTRTFNNN